MSSFLNPNQHPTYFPQSGQGERLWLSIFYMAKYERGLYSSTDEKQVKRKKEREILTVFFFFFLYEAYLVSGKKSTIESKKLDQSL